MTLDFEVPDVSRVDGSRFASGRSAVADWAQARTDDETAVLGLFPGAVVPQRSVCLYVSCTNYKDPNYPPLTVTRANRDNHALRLTSLASSGECFAGLYDDAVDESKIREHLNACARAAGAGGSLLVVVQGHGAKHHPDYYFLPPQATAGTLSDHGVRFSILKRWFNEPPLREVGHVALVCDFCYSHKLHDLWSPADLGAWRQSRQARALIVTSSEGSAPSDGGFFTELLREMTARPAHGLQDAFDGALRLWRDKKDDEVRGSCVPGLWGNQVRFPLRQSAAA